MSHAKTPFIDNAVAGIVITAEVYNPSIFSETWLVQKDIVPAEAFTGIRVFSPELAQFSTSNVQVLVVPQKMQITFPILDQKEEYNLQRNIASKSVELLPQTPYKALGVNFDIFVMPPVEIDFIEYNRNLLGGGENNLLKEFATGDSKFGRYFSKNFGEARLKLDIKPVKIGPEKKDLTRFIFNFHHDVDIEDQEERARKLIEYLESWNDLRSYAFKLIGIGCGF